MADKGYILAWRKVFDPGHWCAPTDRFPACRGWAWLDLCRMAAHTDGYRGRARGEISVGLKFLARRWHWPKTNVVRYLAQLEADGALEKLPSPSGPPQRTPPANVYRIVNYDTYNIAEKKVDPPVGPNRILKYTYTSSDSITNYTYVEEITDVFEHWVRALSKAAGKERKVKLTKHRAGKVNARLEEGFTADELKRAVDGCFLTKFNAEGGWTDLELICRNAVNVERFMKAAPENAVVGPGGVTYV